MPCVYLLLFFNFSWPLFSWLATGWQSMAIESQLLHSYPNELNKPLNKPKHCCWVCNVCCLLSLRAGVALCARVCLTPKAELEILASGKRGDFKTHWRLSERKETFSYCDPWAEEVKVVTTAETSVGSAALLCGIHRAQPGIVSVGTVWVQDLCYSWGGLTTDCNSLIDFI